MQDIKIDGMSDANIRQKIKKLTEEGEVIRYEQGIYYIPKMSRLKGTLTLAPDIVARYKYISRMGALWGTMQDVHWQIKWESQCRYL